MKVQTTGKFIALILSTIIGEATSVSEINDESPTKMQLKGKAIRSSATNNANSASASQKTNNAISIWDGRIIVNVGNENNVQKVEKEEKQMKFCVSSTGAIGYCTRLTHCKGFKLSNLHNNICFMDIFIPGVCCVPEPPRPDAEIHPSHSNDNNAISPTVANETDFKRRNETVEQENKDCGVHTIPSSRIINGDESQSGKWPWMAAIYTLSFLGRNFHCGGSLLSSRHVLTGAHCVKDQRGNTLSTRQLSVRLGDDDVRSLNDRSKTEPGRFYRIESITPHPKFRNIDHYFMNDVAVLKLTENVIFSDTLSPICLPPLESEFEALDKFAGKMSTITGYGRTETGTPSGKLLEATVPIWKNKDCDDSYFAPIIDIFICAGYVEGGKDACQGDSGGPLQIEINNRWTQIGITSFGKGCGEAGYPGVYARVGKFVRWIRRNML